MMDNGIHKMVATIFGGGVGLLDYYAFNFSLGNATIAGLVCTVLYIQYELLDRSGR